MDSPLADLDALLALPRLSGLALSPGGDRLVTTVAALADDGTRFVSSLWQVDPAGEQPAVRLTRSRKGEGSPAFAADGSLLFTSSRPDAGGDEPADDAPAALWQLPAAGEARQVATRPGGLQDVRAARQAQVVVALSDTLPGSVDDDAERRERRRARKVTGILHTGYPVRHWDHDLGPGQLRLLAGELGTDPLTWRDLTPEPGRALDGAAVDLSSDGTTVVLSWDVAEPHGSRRTTLVAVDTRTGERRTLADDGSSSWDSPRISPDGTRVAVLREVRSTPQQPVDTELAVLGLDGSGPTRVAPQWDRWPAEVRWLPDGSALLVTADEAGTRPVFRVELADGAVTRLSADSGHYTDLQVSPDGAHVYALRDAVDAPPAPVRLATSGTGQQPVALLGPAQPLPLPGTLTEVTATAQDGAALRAWLVLPDARADGAPHPLLVWAHGGPLGSWNGWSWRWQPWRLAAAGYAVLLPDPALSTGYGMAMVRRGWGDWGGTPYTDLMALTDAAVERADLDQARTAMMGGSYVANWTAGHTDRFRAIVTHASLWDLPQFAGTTDASYYWLREMTPEMAAVNNPSAHVDAITTPMLVVHGDRDYRVPVGEGLKLWWDLLSRSSGEQTPHRFLLFPDEGHWVMGPQNARTWYETVEAFLAWHVLGEQWETPDALR